MIRNAMLIFCIALLPVVGIANGATHEIKLQCQGRYWNYDVPNTLGIPVGGIYLEILPTTVQVVGTPGLDATYKIISRKKTGIIFGAPVGDGKPAVQGSINRYDGKLDITYTSASFNINTGQGGIISMLEASCRRASPLF